MFASGAGAEAHVFADRGVQRGGRAAVHQETDRLADLHHDQGHGPLRPRPRKGNRRPGPGRRLQQRSLRVGLMLAPRPKELTFSTVLRSK